MTPAVEYFTFDLENERAGLLRRIRDGGSSIEVVSGAKWVDHPDGLKYFEGFGGDQLELIPLTEDEAREQAAALGVTLVEDDDGFAERGTGKPSDLKKVAAAGKPIPAEPAKPEQ